jgi:hypothetical protein
MLTIDPTRRATLDDVIASKWCLPLGLADAAVPKGAPAAEVPEVPPLVPGEEAMEDEEDEATDDTQVDSGDVMRGIELGGALPQSDEPDEDAVHRGLCSAEDSDDGMLRSADLPAPDPPPVARRFARVWK